MEEKMERRIELRIQKVHTDFYDLILTEENWEDFKKQVNLPSDLSFDKAIEKFACLNDKYLLEDDKFHWYLRRKMLGAAKFSSGRDLIEGCFYVQFKEKVSKNTDYAYFRLLEEDKKWLK